MCLMGKATKVSNPSIPPSSSTSTSSEIEENLDDEEAEHKANMIKEFSKKGYKQIKKLMEKLEDRKRIIREHEELIYLEKEKNCVLEESLVEEKVKVEKLELDLSLANDSRVRMSKEHSLANDSLANLKNAYSELQERHSCLEVTYKDLEVNFGALWESTKANSKTSLESNVSTSKGCSKCYNVDIDTCLANLAKLVLLTLPS